MSSISEPITPDSVLSVNTVRCVSCAELSDVDLQDIRVERLKLFAKKHGVENSPGELARLIGKKPNQVTNLLGKHSSFGEKVARSIEQTAGLPAGWLDVNPSTAAVNDWTLPPEVEDAAMQVASLPPKQRAVMLRIIRDSLVLVREAVAVTPESLQSNTQLDAAQSDASRKQANGR